MARDSASTYEEFYRARDPVGVYPVEFVVRAFLGEYPRLTRREGEYRGRLVLDIGFGDGRNMPMLHDLGMKVYGIEISESICELTMQRMRKLGVEIEARVGRNRQIPFGDGFFDQVLACHSCYYIDDGTRFGENVREIGRVLKRGGRFVCSLPIGSSFIFAGARDLGGGYQEITNDPYGTRNGCVLRSFDSEIEIRTALEPLFGELSIGACRNDFWGVEEHVWIVVCRRL